MTTRRTNAVSLALAMLAAGAAGAQTVEWPHYGGDLAHTRYAPLEQINASNFGSLEIAWRFSVANMGPTPEMRLQSTPLVVDGVLYTTGGTRRAVTALDAATGEQLWRRRLPATSSSCRPRTRRSRRPTRRTTSSATSAATTP
jgi:quinoprotein glucose dehydrogenase